MSEAGTSNPVSSDSTTSGSVTSDVTMYTTTWCGYCARLKGQLKRAGVGFTEVDIEQQPGAADIVAKVNGGNQTVPTLVFADGSALTNPSVSQITAKLASLG